jgi:predicted AAA+ superfamily ATPase
MKRNAMQELIEWKERKGRMPLLILGARQVGKTWLMKKFGEENFNQVVYFSMDQNPQLRETFELDFDVERILNTLQLISNTRIDENTLIIFDKIQEIPLAIQSLKYFQENRPELAIVAAGSLLGVALHEGVSFPVGKIELMRLYPLSFLEFLDAIGESRFADLVRKADFETIGIFRDKFERLLKEYFYIGGMPQAVQAFLDDRNFDEVRRIQNNIIQLYEYDLSKHTSGILSERLRLVYESIPSQLGKENKKFVFGNIRSGARSKDYEDAIQWLVDCGLAYRVRRISKPGLPIKAYADLQAFKLYVHDIGLLSAMVNLDVKTIVEGSSIFEEFKGSLTEQYVLSELISELKIEPFYYSAERSTGEVDFVVQISGEVVPIEVKAEENLRAKSLKAYVEKFKPQIAVRTSLSNFHEEDWLINIPLYAITCLKQIVETKSGK